MFKPANAPQRVSERPYTLNLAPRTRGSAKQPGGHLRHTTALQTLPGESRAALICVLNGCRLWGLIKGLAAFTV